MHSKLITNAPVVVFLGAGATRPLGKLLMGEFIERLENDSVFGSDPLFRKIVSQPGGRDLEGLFEELDDWSEKAYIQRDAPETGLVPLLGKVEDKPHQSMVPSFEELTGIAGRAAALGITLRREVFSAYKDIEDPAKAVSLFTPLLDGIFSQLDPRQHPLVIFTTNYDPAIETYCRECSASYELEDGFFENRPAGAIIWRRERFDNFAVSGTKKHIVLFKLHGSARWTKRGAEIMKLPFAVFADAGESYENVLIYPARKKVALDDPFYCLRLLPEGNGRVRMLYRDRLFFPRLRRPNQANVGLHP